MFMEGFLQLVRCGEIGVEAALAADTLVVLRRGHSGTGLNRNLEEDRGRALLFLAVFAHGLAIFRKLGGNCQDFSAFPCVLHENSARSRYEYQDSSYKMPILRTVSC